MNPLLSAVISMHSDPSTPSDNKTNNIEDLLDSFLEIAVLSNGVATHVHGGILDLTLLNTSLLLVADWTLHPYF